MDVTMPAARRTSIAVRTSGSSTYPQDSGESSPTWTFSPSSRETMQPSQSPATAGQRAQSIDTTIYLTFRPGRVARSLSRRDPAAAVGPGGTLGTGYDTLPRTVTRTPPPDGDVRPRRYRLRHAPLHLTGTRRRAGRVRRARAAAVRGDLRRRRPRDHRHQAGRRRDHRDRRRPDPGRRGAGGAVHLRLDRRRTAGAHQQADGDRPGGPRRRTVPRRGDGDVPRVLARRCPGGAQRQVRPRLPPRRRSRDGPPVAGSPVRVHPRTRPAGAAPRRDAWPPARGPGRTPGRHGRAQSPRPTGRARHGGRAARPHLAGG